MIGFSKVEALVNCAKPNKWGMLKTNCEKMCNVVVAQLVGKAEDPGLIPAISNF